MKRIFYFLMAACLPMRAADITTHRVDGQLVLDWDADQALLEQSSKVTGPWTVVPDASSPWQVSTDELSAFYRLRLDSAPRILSVEPPFLDSEDTDGATLYLRGRHLSPSLQVRVGGQVVGAPKLLNDQLMRIDLPFLGEGTYRVELVDAEGTVISRLWPPLTIGNASKRDFQPPPTEGEGDCRGCDGLPREIEHLRLSSGEVRLKQTDLRLRGRGLDVTWERTYLSRAGLSTAQGHGWDYSYNIYLTSHDEHLVFHDGHGRADRFFLQEDGTYSRPELSRRIRKHPDGSFTLQFADGAEWDFHPLDAGAAGGKIVRMADRNFNRLLFSYHNNGQLAVITDSLDRELTIGYTPQGMIGSVTDFTGRVVRYGYYQNNDTNGSQGDLRSVTSPAVIGLANGNNFPNGKITRFTYTTGFGDERLNHNLLTVVDPKNQTWLRTVYAPTEDPSHFLFDRAIRQVHGDAGDVIDVAYVRQTPAPTNDFAAVTAVVNDRDGRVSEHVYDVRNRLISHRALTGLAEPDEPTTLTLNRPKNRLRDSDPDGFETKFAWTESSKLARVIHPSGEMSERTYESDVNPNAHWRDRGNLRMIRRIPNGNGVDHAPVVETFYYDSELGGCCGANFVTRHIDANSNRTRHVYDDRGNRIRTLRSMPGVTEEWEYNEFGQMTAHIHPDNGEGHRQRDEFVYHVNGPQKGYLAAQITDVTGVAMTIQYEYDARGNMVRSTDPNGRVSTAQFNDLDQLVQETTREVVDGSDVRYVRTNFYDANDNLIRKDHLNLDEVGNVRPNETLSVQFQFDILNEEIREIREISDNRDIVNETIYDGNRRVILKRSGQATGADLDWDTSGAQPFNVVAFRYDERGLPYQRIVAAGGARQKTQQIDYDLDGLAIRVWENLEDGLSPVSMEYDGLHRVRRRVDPMGNVASFVYDPNGNIIHERFEGELEDVPGDAGNVRLWEKEYFFDAMNRLIVERVAHFDLQTQDPVGDGWSTSTTVYTPRSSVRRVVDDNGHVQERFYDSANRLAREVDAKGNERRREYDASGNVVTMIEIAKSDAGLPDRAFTSRLEYDNLNRHTATIDPMGHRTELVYDALDNLVLIKDAKGNRTRYDYDGYHRIIRQHRFITADGTGNSPVQETIITFKIWDDNSRLIAQIDGNGNTTRYAYDEMNRRIVTRQPDGTLLQIGRGAAWPGDTAFPDLSGFESGYDAEGHPVVLTDANGTEIHYTYDPLNRLTGKQIVPGTGVAADTTFEQFAYDGVSRLVRAIDDDATILRSYDSLGGLTLESLHGQTIDTRYDGVGNLLRCVYPSGLIMDFTWDELNRLQGVQETGQPQSARYGYFGPRHVESLALATSLPGRSLRSTWSYDDDQRLERVAHAQVLANGGIPFKMFTVEYDANDNPILRRALVGLLGEENIAYDSVNRLVGSVEEAPIGNPLGVQYHFDPVGNRTSVESGMALDRYDSSNPLNQYDGTPWADQVFDPNGNLTRQSAGQTQRRFQYDYANRLVRVIDEGSTVAFHYDALGRRIGKAVSGPIGMAPRETRYFYLGQRILEDQEGDENNFVSYLPGARPDEVIGMRRGGKWVFFHRDDLGNVAAVTDADGQLVESYTYDDYGQPSFFDGVGNPIAGSLVGNAYLFQARPYDVETGLYHFRHRDLDPLSGRFLTRDPLGTWGDALNMGNAYTYAGNNPNRYVDPTGLSSTTRSSFVSSKNVTLTIKFTDCSTSKMDQMEDNPDFLSNTFASLEDAHDDVHAQINGGTPVESSTLSEMKRWFSGSGTSGTLNSGEKDDIHDVLWGVEDHMRNKTIKFECETSSNNSCNGVNAYVPWASNTMHLCPNFWGSGNSDDERAAIIFHEMTHAYEGTDDKGYVSGNKSFGTPTYVNSNNNSITLTKSKLLKNADTYEEFLQNTWLP